MRFRTGVDALVLEGRRRFSSNERPRREVRDLRRRIAAAGAEIVATPADVLGRADVIIKVKEPLEPEWKIIRKGQLLFTYFHFAASRPLAEAMIRVPVRSASPTRRSKSAARFRCSRR
jgi:hypothetical protein